ncbi:MAG: hypothetical protein HY315_02920 [Acidobacteria bacterium]|nr:hypothetical protein [Acidobacteriota bacterium]
MIRQARQPRQHRGTVSKTLRKMAGLALVAGAIALGSPRAAVGQCAMCRTALLNSPEGRALSGAFNRAILVLFGAPFLAAGGVAFLVYRARQGSNFGSPDPASSLPTGNAANGRQSVSETTC